MAELWTPSGLVAAEQNLNVLAHKKCINYANHLRGKQEGKIENSSTFLPLVKALKN